MSDIAIKVEKISKRYRIGSKEERADTLIGGITSWIKSPFSNFRNLQKLSKFGEKDDGEDILWALKDVSFNVKQGEVVGIIGRNGAGKSTLLKILSRITEPTSGKVTINGRVSSLLEVGTGFHPELTGRENIYLNGTVLGMSKIEIDRKFDEIVAFSEVEKFLDTPVKRYSSGMGVRLAFAVAAHLEPEILVIDEVLAVGDIAFQKKCLSKMEDVAGEGRTVLFVSHNMSAIKTLCQSAVMLNEGKNVFEGPADIVISKFIEKLLDKGNTEKLLPEMHQCNSGDLWIEQVTIMNEDGELIDQLRLNDVFTVIVRFKVIKSIKNARLGLGFNTLDGMRISTCHHTDSGQALLSLDCGLYEASLRMINPLLPGQYIIGVGAHSGLGGTLLDYVPYAKRFDVLKVANDQNEYKASTVGLVRFKADWSPVTKVL